MLQLSRRLIFLDLESTGTNVQEDRIVEVGMLLCDPEGMMHEWNTLINPLCIIPSAAVDKHHITNEKVALAPTFALVAPTLLNAFNDVDFAGYNVIHYDIPLLQAEFKRIGLEWDPYKNGSEVIDVQQIFFKKEPRSLEGAVRYYCSKEYAEQQEAEGNYHAALADCKASLEVLQGQFKKYEGMPVSVKELAQWSRPDDWFDREGKLKRQGESIVFNFGKWHGRTVEDVAVSTPDYLQWILDNDFPSDVKDYCFCILNKIPEQAIKEVERWAERATVK